MSSKYQFYKGRTQIENVRKQSDKRSISTQMEEVDQQKNSKMSFLICILTEEADVEVTF
jgi:hypothetical protein